MFTTLPAALEPIVGMRRGEHISGRGGGYFASIRAGEEPLKGCPAVTQQASWNISDVCSGEGGGADGGVVVQRRRDADTEPAVVAGDNCVFVTHVLLGDDAANKRQLFWRCWDIWRRTSGRDAANRALAQSGAFGPL